MADAAGTSDAAFDATQRTEHTEPREDRPRLPRGTQVDRYLVLEVLGAGGMGVVYSAYDPELDRKVAIKLLMTRGKVGTAEEERAWVLREAQALARLAHPNVVAVYDVGTLDDDRVFVAMELVAGITLRAWLESAKRTWRDVVPIMAAAGAGLAAAHAVGLVHRDFKPENVIVGHDGRTRVMDFGLARLRRDGFDEQAARASDLQIDVHSPLSQQLTVHGAIVGTPAYLAPEIYGGHAADARSDQYAFGVALYVALFAKVPYDLAAIVEGTAKPPKPPSEPAVPAWLQRVVLRAIAIAPADRYPSMDALLRDLAHDATPKRRLLVVGGALALAAGAVAFATRAESAACTGIDQRLAGTWDATAKQAVKTAYLATKLPYAERAFAALDGALDRYSHEWVTMATSSCLATRVRREQAEDIMSLRQACLDRRLAALHSLVRELGSQPSPVLVQKADGPVYELETLDGCADIEGLKRPGMAPNDPRIMLVEPQLADTSAQLITGHYMAALVQSQRLIDATDAIGYAPIQADAHRYRGAALLGVQSYEEGVGEFVLAMHKALASNRDDLAASMAFYAAMFDAEFLKRPAEAKIWLDIGMSEAARVPMSDSVELMRYSAAGIVSASNGDPLAAVAAHRKALEVAVRMYGQHSYPLLAAEIYLATSLDRASMFADSIEHFQHALDLATAIAGPEHPDRAILLGQLGTSYGKGGRQAEARQAFASALELLNKQYGANSPLLVITLNNFADNLNVAGDAADALEQIDRALKIAQPLGKDHLYVHTASTTRGEILVNLHRYDEARVQYDTVIESEERVHSMFLPMTLASRAELAITEHAWPATAAFAQRAIAALEAAGGKDNPELWRPLSLLGRAEVELGKREDARPHLERAIAIGEKLQLPHGALEPARAALATLR
jgi:tetratricopeptide (TPR) repeat protein